MLRFPAHRITREEACQIAAWRYEPPYERYAEPNAQALWEGSFYCVPDAQGEPAAFFTMGEDARVSCAQASYEAEPALLDIGMGMRPDLIGHGWGLSLVEYVMEFLCKTQGATGFRLAVYAWNMRAIRVYTRAGFTQSAWYAWEGETFIIMTMRPPIWLEATRPLQMGMTVYPGDPPFVRKRLCDPTQGGYDVSVLCTCVHTGTHVDAPTHVGLSGGTDTLEMAQINRVAQLLDLTGGTAPCVQPEELTSLRAVRVLLCTAGRSLSYAAAEALVSRHVQMLGVDGMSVGPQGEEGLRVHRLLLGAGMVLLENAALERLEAGYYAMRCMPLLLPGSDGAPVRLWLRRA